MFSQVSVCPWGEYLGKYTPQGGTPPVGTGPGQVTPPQQLHPPGQVHDPHWAGTPPGAVHAGRYAQQADGTHPTGMQSCFFLYFFFYHNSFSRPPKELSPPFQENHGSPNSPDAPRPFFRPLDPPLLNLLDIFQCRKNPPPEQNINTFCFHLSCFINLIPKLTMLTLKCAL